MGHEDQATTGFFAAVVEALGLVKAVPRSHKYIRREPTGNPLRPWRYYYRDEHGREYSTHEPPRIENHQGDLFGGQGKLELDDEGKGPNKSEEPPKAPDPPATAKPSAAPAEAGPSSSHASPAATRQVAPPVDPTKGAHDLGEHLPMSRRERWWLEHGDELRERILGGDHKSLAEAEEAGAGRKVINRQALLGTRPEPDDLRDEGNHSGAALLKTELYDAIPPQAPDTAEGRQAYADMVRSLWLRTRDARTTSDVREALGEFWRDAVRNEDFPDPERRAELRAKIRARFMRVSDEAVEYHYDVALKTLAAEKLLAVGGKRLAAFVVEAARDRIPYGVRGAPKDAARNSAIDVFHRAMDADNSKWVVRPDLLGTKEEAESTARARTVWHHPAVGKQPSHYTVAGLPGQTFATREEAFAASKQLPFLFSPETNRAPLPGEDYTFDERGLARTADGQKADRQPMPPEQQSWDWANEGSKERGVREAQPWRLERIEPAADPPGRKGPAVPEGADADILKRFGIRGVQHGNYMTEADRAHHGRQAVVALHDLADILGLPLGVVSYNGRLGLAFGARGGGRFAAHYEPNLKVINITRDRGGGALAHEWGHFLDHTLGTLSSRKGLRTSSFASDLAPDSIEGDPEGKLKLATVKVVEAMSRRPRTQVYGPAERTSYYEHSVALGEYWGRPHEMLARAFEAYVTDKLAAAGRSNTYLVSGSRTHAVWATRHNKRTGETRSLYAYPRGEERTRINAAFDEFFGALRSSETVHKAFGLADEPEQASFFGRLCKYLYTSRRPTGNPRHPYEYTYPGDEPAERAKRNDEPAQTDMFAGTRNAQTEVRELARMTVAELAKVVHKVLGLPAAQVRTHSSAARSGYVVEELPMSRRWVVLAFDDFARKGGDAADKRHAYERRQLAEAVRKLEARGYVIDKTRFGADSHRVLVGRPAATPAVRKGGFLGLTERLRRLFVGA